MSGPVTKRVAITLTLSIIVCLIACEVWVTYVHTRNSSEQRERIEQRLIDVDKKLTEAEAQRERLEALIIQLSNQLKKQ